MNSFWKNVARGEPSECWPWKLGRNKDGYGKVKFQGRTMGSHRVAFFLEHGSWPNVARHTCDNVLCCNPGHLLDGSQADNRRDCVERGRQSKGSGRWNSSLTELDVTTIRALFHWSGFSRREIAEEYPVSAHTIWGIVRFKTWTHVPFANLH